MKAVMTAASVLLISACYYDKPPVLIPFECDEVSYSTHIQPIWDNSCATSGCHNGTTEPNLSDGVSLNALLSGGYVNTLLPEESSLYHSVDFISNPMPPGGPKLSDQQIELILCWISEGAPNN